MGVRRIHRISYSAMAGLGQLTSLLSIDVFLEIFFLRVKHIDNPRTHFTR